MKKRKVILFLSITLGIMLMVQSSFAQLHTFSFEKTDSLLQIEKRPMVVFIHTSWCKYCEMMRHTTFKAPEVIDLLNKEFYYITLDGEGKEDIEVRGHTFSYQPTGANTGTHELAWELGNINGQLTYPTITFLDNEYGIIFQHSGFLSAKQLKAILRKSKQKTTRSGG